MVVFPLFSVLIFLIYNSGAQCVPVDCPPPPISCLPPSESCPCPPERSPSTPEPSPSTPEPTLSPPESCPPPPEIWPPPPHLCPCERPPAEQEETIPPAEQEEAIPLPEQDVGTSNPDSEKNSGGSCNCSPVPKDRCKREIGSFTYPYPGTWYQNTLVGKKYLHLGESMLVQRNNGFYSKWLLSEGDKWVLSDNLLWRWDVNGTWYSIPDDDGTSFPKMCATFVIPINCTGQECPQRIRYPSNGKWIFEGGNTTFAQEGGIVQYQLRSDGFYEKFSGNVRICPQTWSWNLTTGIWTPIEGDRSNCEDLIVPKENVILSGQKCNKLHPPKKAFLL